MAKFKDITESINYVAETVPVVALSLKPQLQHDIGNRKHQG